MARRVRPSPPAGAHWPRTLALPDSTLLSSHVAPPAHRRHTWTERDTYAGPRPHWGSDEDRTMRQADEGSPETATSGPYTLGMRYPTRQCDWGVGVSGSDNKGKGRDGQGKRAPSQENARPLPHPAPSLWKEHGRVAHLGLLTCRTARRRICGGLSPGGKNLASTSSRTRTGWSLAEGTWAGGPC